MSNSTKNDIDLLIYLAEQGSLYKEVELSTIEVSKNFNSSQQTISRKLIDLESQNMIKRNASTRGIRLAITEEGRSELKHMFSRLKGILEEKVKAFKGIVESGLGEGGYYVSLKPYLTQFKEKLGLVPYKGTLNLKVDYTKLIQLISSQRKIMVDGFQAEKRTFGPIIAYKIKINGIESAILIPERTSHSREIIEVISDINFREEFKLKDGDKVTIST